MPPVSLRQVLEVCGAESPDKEGESLYSRFVFDSRMAQDKGSLFFALQGEHQDGHRFVAALSGRDGVAAVVRRTYSDPLARLPLIRVEDPLEAAQNLAIHVRDCMNETRFVGVTGSAGKTSAKEFIFHILGHGARTYRSPGNWNNWIGLPFALLNMEGNESRAVFELGMSSPGIGEIDLLSRILRPHVAVILNALPVHLEFLGTVERVAQAKCEILNGLIPGGRVLFNVDSPELRALVPTLGRKREELISFSPTGVDADVHYRTRKAYPDGMELHCSFFDEQFSLFTSLTHPAQQANILAAVAVARVMGMEASLISAAVSTLPPVAGRGSVKHIFGVTILDETYNSNPEAARCALDWLASFSAPRVAVLGDMLELGEKSDAYHRQLGIQAASKNLKLLCAVGEKGRLIAEAALQAGLAEAKVRWFATAEAAQPVLRTLLQKGDVALFKASRGLALEKALPG